MPTPNTALTSAFIVSTTAGTHSNAINSDGISIINALIGSGKLVVCLMSKEHDYDGNEPSDGGSYTRVKCYFSEYSGTSRDPELKLTYDDASTSSIYSTSTGNDDDGYISNSNFDDTKTWAQIRGDETTTGSFRNVTLNNAANAIYARMYTGRGAVIRDCTRSYFVFNLSAESGTVASSTIHFYLDNIGTSTGDSAKIIAVRATTLAGSTADFGNCYVEDTVATPSQNVTFFGANF